VVENKPDDAEEERAAVVAAISAGGTHQMDGNVRDANTTLTFSNNKSAAVSMIAGVGDRLALLLLKLSPMLVVSTLLEVLVLFRNATDAATPSLQTAAHPLADSATSPSGSVDATAAAIAPAVSPAVRAKAEGPPKRAGEVTEGDTE
jgi:hypothetical protein